MGDREAKQEEAFSDEAVTVKRAPATYREMSVPFESREAINAMLSPFFEELYALRVKHRVRDLYVIASASWMDDGEEAETIMPMCIGDETKAESLVAWAHGFERGQSETRAARAMAGGKKRGSRV